MVRREQERTPSEAVRQALIEGECSGEPQPIDFAAFALCKRAQRIELDRRLDAYEADCDPGRPAEAALQEIRKRL